MKRIGLITILLFIMISANVVYSQCLTLIVEKNIDEMDLEFASQAKFQLSNKNIIGSYLVITPIKEIDKIIKEKSLSPETQSIIISFESFTDKKYYSYADFSNNVSPLPVYLLTQEKVKFRAGDTVQYGMKGNRQTTDVDLTNMIEHTFSVMVTNVKLQISKISDADKKEYFSTQSLIFPADLSTTRWFSAVKKMKIYIIEK